MNSNSRYIKLLNKKIALLDKAFEVTKDAKLKKGETTIDEFEDLVNRRGSIFEDIKQIDENMSFISGMVLKNDEIVKLEEKISSIAIKVSDLIKKEFEVSDDIIASINNDIKNNKNNKNIANAYQSNIEFTRTFDISK